MRWLDLLLETDPDVIIGYNIINFDLPYLYERATVGERGVGQRVWVGCVVGGAEVGGVGGVEVGVGEAFPNCSAWLPRLTEQRVVWWGHALLVGHPWRVCGGGGGGVCVCVGGGVVDDLAMEAQVGMQCSGNHRQIVSLRP